MDEMELIKEVVFGKAIARVTVEGTFINKTFSQFVEGGEVVITKKIEIVHNGEVVGKARHISPIEYNEIYDRTYEKHGLDTGKTYSQIKGVAICEGRETADTINQLIEEMEREIIVQLKDGTDEEIVEKANEIEAAKEIVKIAERQGADKLMTKSEIREWRKNYNKVVNEDGEGYIPNVISKEQYNQAFKTLGCENQ